MKQTAVEWLHEILATSQLEDMEKNTNLWFQQAKEMEKQQICEAYLIGDTDAGIYSATKKNAEQYYNETFENY